MVTVGSVCSTLSTLGGAKGANSCSLTASPTASGTKDSIASSTRYSLPTKFCNMALGALPFRNPGILTRWLTRLTAAFMCRPTRSESTSKRSTISPLSEASRETFNPNSFVSLLQVATSHGTRATVVFALIRGTVTLSILTYRPSHPVQGAIQANFSSIESAH